MHSFKNVHPLSFEGSGLGVRYNRYENSYCLEMAFITHQLRDRLQQSPYWVVTLFGGVSAFMVYFCMYAYRKPFTAATYGEITWLGIDYKVWLILAQTVGYTLSKFYGIRLVAELAPQRRAQMILLLIVGAWGALLGFALVPTPYNIIFLLLNGLPLGMIWGIVFNFLEGRKATELMGVLLSVSFIVSSGFVKSVGQWVLLAFEVSAFWMPFITGAFFFPLLGASLWGLSQLPEPTLEDQRLRSKRVAMNKENRRQFVGKFLTGILMLVSTYVVLTALRDFRDNFAAEIWKSLGYTDNPSIFTLTEIPIALVVLGMMGGLILLKNNFQALLINHVVILFGLAMLLVANLLFQRALLPPIWWMILIGMGLYIAYVPFNCLLFERLIATFRYPGNVGFIMYVADSFGYLGSVSILFYKELLSDGSTSWLLFYTQSLTYAAGIAIVFVMLSALYFWKKYSQFNTQQLSTHGI